MKAIFFLILGFSIFTFGCDRKMNIFNNDKTFVLLSAQGNDADIRKIYFVVGDSFNVKKGEISIHYYRATMQLNILYDSVLIAYYYIEKNDQGIFINNYTPV